MAALRSPCYKTRMSLPALLLLLAAVAPTTTPLDQATPKAALKAFSQSLDAGDRNAILSFLAADTDQEKKIAAMTADLAEAAAQLRAATIKAFGEKDARPLGVDPTAAAAATARIDSSIETRDGDKVTIRPADNEGPPMTLIQRDGKWLLPVAELSKDVEKSDIEKNLGDIAAQIKVMREVASEVAAGKFQSAVDARQALDQRIVKGALPATEPATTPAAKP
jgi:hypothetical protein